MVWRDNKSVFEQESQLPFWPRDAKHRGPRSGKVGAGVQTLLEKFVETLEIVFIVFNGYISR